MCTSLESGDETYISNMIQLKINGPGLGVLRSKDQLLRRGPGPILMSTCIVVSFISVICAGDWIRERFEKPGVMKLTEEEKKVLLARLVRSTK